MIKDLSIIIPVFNNSVSFSNCIDSLTKQINKNFDVIIIDDYSDNFESTKILSCISQSGIDYIYIKNNQNKGPGYSRNVGISNAKSKYITFIDSDDFVNVDFTDDIIENMVKKDLDTLIFNMNIHKNGKVKCLKSINLFNSTMVDNKYALVYTLGGTVCKAYKKEIIQSNDIVFLEKKRNEDMPFTKKAIMKSKKIFYLNKTLYNYIRHESSLMSNKSLLDPSNAIDSVNYLLCNYNISDYKKELEAIYIKEIIYSTTVTVASLNKKNSEILNHIKKVESTYPNWKKNKYIKKFPLHTRVILKIIQFRLLFLLSILSRKRG